MTHPAIPSDSVVGQAAPVLSAKPVVLDGGDRGVDLHVKVSAPAAGENLPVILFSHGFGSSGEMYQPLVDFYAAHGFVVVQPTYLDSRALGVDPHDPRAAQFWRLRIEDAKRVLDNLDTVVGAIPGLAPRVDADRIGAVGHSFGGQTTALLLGLRVLAPAGHGQDLSDSRVKAGVLLATAGTGGDDLAPGIIDNLPWLNVSFDEMRTPALVVYGDHDQSVLTTRGPDWGADAFHLSPAPKSLLRLSGIEHSLGGAVGYDSFETTDNNPAAVAVLQRATTAYLRTQLGIDVSAWDRLVSELRDDANGLAFVESK
ncbi:alpha/beta hydrolase family protein [Gordonia sp. DT30]|uniref:alpha/beta hydrolase family protein n=1 Tax=Gordonia sp. DT30 TaxID=3416546 RepID=UPI003CE93A16